MWCYEGWAYVFGGGNPLFQGKAMLLSQVADLEVQEQKFHEELM